MAHSQVVVLQEEIGTQMSIGSLTFVEGYDSYSTAALNFSISMAHVTISELSETFADNYEPGSLVEVCFLDTLNLTGVLGDEISIQFDTPFYYNGTDNLLIDIDYSDGSTSSYVYNWFAGQNRCLADYYSPGGSSGATGNLYQSIPYMIFEPPDDLNRDTFGGIKVILGGTQ